MQHAIYLFYYNSWLFDHFVEAPFYKVYACHIFCRCYDFYAFD